MITTLFTALACLLAGIFLGRWRQSLAQNTGEGAVMHALAQRFPSPDYHLLNNVTLPIDGGTTQIDHILVSRYGVFVIETKHYKGWIFGNPSSAQWTQVLYKKSYKFQNPIYQNKKHCGAVLKLLDFLPSDSVRSVVVFTGGAVFKTPGISNVLSMAGLLRHVESFTLAEISENRMQFCVGRLECKRKQLTRQTDIEHVQYLQRKFGDAA